MVESWTKIILVEDDRRLGFLIKDYLEKSGSFEIRIIERGDVAVEKIIAEKPDLVILDLMLPGLDGMSVCRKVRPVYQGLIMMFTAQEDDMDQVAGLELGADDYVKKPVEPRVLLARVRALLRRTEKSENDSSQAGKEKLVFGKLEIIRNTYDVYLKKQKIDLTTREFDLLYILAKNADKVQSRDDIMRQLRGFEFDGLDRSIDITVSRLRKKLKTTSDDSDKNGPEKIKTIWGQGYVFLSDGWE